MAETEAALGAIEAELQDPALYLTAEGGRRAAELGRALETARREFEAAFAEWEAATAAADASHPSLPH